MSASLHLTTGSPLPSKKPPLRAAGVGRGARAGAPLRPGRRRRGGSGPALRPRARVGADMGGRGALLGRGGRGSRRASCCDGCCALSRALARGMCVVTRAQARAQARAGLTARAGFGGALELTQGGVPARAGEAGLLAGAFRRVCTFQPGPVASVAPEQETRSSRASAAFWRAGCGLCCQFGALAHVVRLATFVRSPASLASGWGNGVTDLRPESSTEASRPHLVG